MSKVVAVADKVAVPDFATEALMGSPSPILDLADARAPEAVEAWLASLDQSTVCGTSGQAGSCPLATYLTTTAKASGIEMPRAFVGGFNWAVNDAEGERHTGQHPGWVRRFISAVDARRGKARSVTARVARRLLRESLAQGQD